MQGLIIFNPNLLSLVHHAQSDLIFMVVMTILFVLVGKILHNPHNTRIGLFIATGIVVGMLPLVRPPSLYYIVTLPVIIIGLLSIGRGVDVDWKKITTGIFVAFIVAIVVLSPWALRNKTVFGDYSLTHSEGMMMEWHYWSIQRYRTQHESEKRDGYYFEKYGVNECGETGDCKSRIVGAYLHAIRDLPKLDVGYALVISWSRLMFSGGFNQLGRYLGISEHVRSDLGPSGMDREVRKLTFNFKKAGEAYWLLFIVTTVFALICRGVGFVGLASIFRHRPTRRYTIFYLITLIIFMGLYLFSSIVRFRAPLEPILMLFATIGFSLFALKFRWLTKSKE